MAGRNRLIWFAALIVLFNPTNGLASGPGHHAEAVGPDIVAAASLASQRSQDGVVLTQLPYIKGDEICITTIIDEEPSEECKASTDLQRRELTVLLETMQNPGGGQEVKYAQSPYEACKGIEFTKYDDALKDAKFQRLLLISQACRLVGTTFNPETSENVATIANVLAPDSGFFRRMLAGDPELPPTAKTEEIDTTLEFGIFAGESITGQLEALRQDLKLTQACFIRKNENKPLDTDCVARIDKARAEYTEKLKLIRYNLLLTGNLGTGLMSAAEEFGLRAFSLKESDYTPAPGLYRAMINSNFKDYGDTMVPDRSQDSYTKVSDTEMESVRAEVTKWHREVLDAWKADWAKLSEWRKEKGMKALTYLDNGRAQDFYRTFMREKREAHEADVTKSLQSAPIFMFLTKNADLTTASDFERAFALAAKSNIDAQNELKQTLIEARREQADYERKFAEYVVKAKARADVVNELRAIEQREPKGRRSEAWFKFRRNNLHIINAYGSLPPEQPDTGVAGKVLFGKGAIEKMLSTNPNLCAAALAFHDGASSAENRALFGKMGIWMGAIIGSTIVFGPLGTSATVAAGVLTGAGMGYDFYVMDSAFEESARKFAESSTLTPSPGDIEEYMSRKFATLISAYTVVLPFKQEMMFASSILMGYGIARGTTQAGKRYFPELVGAWGAVEAKGLSTAWKNVDQLYEGKEGQRFIKDLYKKFYGKRIPSYAQIKETDVILRGLFDVDPNSSLRFMRDFTKFPNEYIRQVDMLEEFMKTYRSNRGRSLASAEDIGEFFRIMQHATDGVVVPPGLEKEFLDMSYALMHAGAPAKEALATAKRFLKMAENVPAGISTSQHIRGLTSAFIEAQAKVTTGVQEKLVAGGILKKGQTLRDLAPHELTSALNAVTVSQRRAAFDQVAEAQVRLEVNADEAFTRTLTREPGDDVTRAVDTEIERRLDALWGCAGGRRGA